MSAAKFAPILVKYSLKWFAIDSLSLIIWFLTVKVSLIFLGFDVCRTSLIVFQVLRMSSLYLKNWPLYWFCLAILINFFKILLYIWRLCFDSIYSCVPGGILFKWIDLGTKYLTRQPHDGHLGEFLECKSDFYRQSN